MADMVENTRNIALVAHGGAGSTSLAEIMLYKSGVTNRIGRVEDGNTAMDFEPEELRRQTTISTSFHRFEWKKHTVHIMDCPGDQNFFADTKVCMQAADCALFVVDAIDGVKVQTELAWDFAKEYGQPCVMFINKLDRERADFSAAFSDASDALEEAKLLQVQIPIGSEDDPSQPC